MFVCLDVIMPETFQNSGPFALFLIKLDACFDSIVDEPQLSSYLVSLWQPICKKLVLYVDR